MSSPFFRPDDDRAERIQVVLRTMLGDDIEDQTKVIQAQLKGLSASGIVHEFDAFSLTSNTEFESHLGKLLRIQKAALRLIEEINKGEAELESATAILGPAKVRQGLSYPPILNLALCEGPPSSTKILVKAIERASDTRAARLRDEQSSLLPKQENADGRRRRKRSASNLKAEATALRLARIYGGIKGKLPKPSMANDGKTPGGPYTKALEKIFLILGLNQVSVKGPAKRACKKLKDKQQTAEILPLVNAMLGLDPST